MSERYPDIHPWRHVRFFGVRRAIGGLHLSDYPADPALRALLEGWNVNIANYRKNGAIPKQHQPSERMWVSPGVYKVRSKPGCP